jgi:hypothetical protein
MGGTFTARPERPTEPPPAPPKGQGLTAAQYRVDKALSSVRAFSRELHRLDAKCKEQGIHL